MIRRNSTIKYLVWLSLAAVVACDTEPELTHTDTLAALNDASTVRLNAEAGLADALAEDRPEPCVGPNNPKDKREPNRTRCPCSKDFDRVICTGGGGWMCSNGLWSYFDDGECAFGWYPSTDAEASGESNATADQHPDGARADSTDSMSEVTDELPDASALDAMSATSTGNTNISGDAAPGSNIDDAGDAISPVQ